jgi:hypothetical protein
MIIPRRQRGFHDGDGRGRDLKIRGQEATVYWQNRLLGTISCALDGPEQCSIKHSRTRTASASSIIFALKTAFKIESILRWECAGRASQIAEKTQIIASVTAVVFIA